MRSQSTFRKRVLYRLIQISKEESLALRKRFPALSISIVNRQKKHGRKKYYVEESGFVLRALNKMRSENVEQKIFRKW